MHRDEFIEGLRIALCWEHGTFSQTVRSAYERQLEQGVDAVIAALAKADPPAAEAAHLLLQALSPAQRADFIAAPHIASLIISPALLAHRYHRKFFLKYLGICAGCIFDDLALYDHRGVAITPAAAELGRHRQSGRYAVSFAGDLPIPSMDRGGNRVRPVPSDCASVILGKLDAAEQLIRNINRNASAFALQQTEVLAFRFEDEYPASFCSGSFKTLPGFSLVTNCHLPGVDERDLADTIVHEAIHAIISRFEAFGDGLVKSGVVTPAHVVSPWTGARLGVEPFAQACFVWFGLHHFWKNAAGTASGSFGDRATKGFVSGDYAACCRSSADHLSPGVAAQLEALARHL